MKIPDGEVVDAPGGSAPVVLVSQELVRQYFAKQDPIGLRIHIGPPSFMNIPPGADTTDSTDVTIVGVIGDFRNGGLAAPPEPQMIALNSQHPLVTYGFRDIVVRTAADPHLQRRHELAIRAAVGASAQNILWLVLKEGLRMAAIGAFVGIVGAVAAQKLISGLLFGVSAIDPLTFAGAALFLVTVVMVACSLPAWRASRVDPCSALRAE